MGSRQQESVFKGRVKRLLREQEDMGQVADPAIQCCVAAVEALVRDLGRQLRAQAEAQAQDDEGGGIGAVVTPVDLKRVVLADPTLAFLRATVERIDERDAKFHKRPPRKRKAAAAAPTKRAKKAAAPAAAAAPAPPAKQQAAAAITIEEDDDYDESDSE